MAGKAARETVVVITGGTAGVGRATANLYAAEGARLGVIARGQDRLAETARDLERRGAAQVVAIAADVAAAEAVDAAAARVEQELGPIDIWINNAMTTVFGPFLQMSPADFQRVTEVTYLGFVHGTLAALRRMVPRDRGVVVQVGSALAYRGIPLQSAYCGAKHAIQGFTEAVRCELMHDDSHVRLTMVQMPALNTPQFGWCKALLPRAPQPVPPIYQPEVAARAIHWAARHRRRELWVGGNVVVLLWGNRFFPGLGDRYLARTGFGSQQTDRPLPADRPFNLWEPVAGNQGAHGAFEARAHARSHHFWWNTHPATTAAVAVALLGGFIVALQILF